MANPAYSVDFSPIGAVGQEMATVGRDMRQAAYQGKEMKMREDAANREQKKFNWEKKLYEEAEAAGNKPMDITTHPAYLSLSDEGKKNWLHYMASNGATNPQGVGKTKDIMQKIDEVEKTKGLFTTLMAPEVESKKRAVLDAWKELQAVKTKSTKADDKKLLEAQESFKNASMDYNASNGNFTQHLEKLDKDEKALTAIDAQWNALSPEEKADPIIKGTFDSARITRDLKPVQTMMEKVKEKTIGDKTTNDFTTFKAGMPKKAGETDADWNKRVSEAWHKNKVGEAIKVGVTTGEARASAYMKSRMYAVTDNVTGKRVYRSGAVLNSDVEGRFTPLAGDVELAEQKGAARTRMGTRSAAVQTSAGMLSKEEAGIIALREKVQRKNLLPTGGFKDLEALNQWMLSKASDPDAALLQRKVKLLADNLQRTMGSTQGGQWAFQVAADILDPTLSTPAFKNVYRSHAQTLKSLANEYKIFGKEAEIITAPDDKPLPTFH